jgi:hypothetical protein
MKKKSFSLGAFEELEVPRRGGHGGQDTLRIVVDHVFLDVGAVLLKVDDVAGGGVEPHPVLVVGVFPENKLVFGVSEGVRDEALSHVEVVDEEVAQKGLDNRDVGGTGALFVIVSGQLASVDDLLVAIVLLGVAVGAEVPSDENLGHVTTGGLIALHATLTRLLLAVLLSSGSAGCLGIGGTLRGTTLRASDSAESLEGVRVDVGDDGSYHALGGDGKCGGEGGGIANKEGKYCGADHHDHFER